jgi:hypothetical protein
MKNLENYDMNVKQGPFGRGTSSKRAKEEGDEGLNVFIKIA